MDAPPIASAPVTHVVKVRIAAIHPGFCEAFSLGPLGNPLRHATSSRGVEVALFFSGLVTLGLTSFAISTDRPCHFAAVFSLRLKPVYIPGT